MRPHVSRPALCSVSVVVPLYNEQEIISDLQLRLRDALEQTGLPWEVVFVDDGSRDATADLAGAIHANDPRFKALRDAAASRPTK